jgi:dipeptidyl aminopeptidase/acylaminoacyl peptidase
MRYCRILPFILLFALPAFSLSALAQSKHPFTFEDMMKLKRVEEPQVSPNGKWVLFAAVDVDLAANTKTPHVWIVPTAGGREKEIISDQDADRPRWSPDGKRFAFISTKEGGSQVWIADFDGNSGNITGTHKLTSMATEASGELWSPDGKNVLFVSNVYPECDGTPAELSCNAKKLKEANDSKVKAQIFDHLLYRHWDAYKEGKRTHIFVVEVPRYAGNSITITHILLPARDLTPGDYDAPVFSLGGQDNYAFSPDGNEICYTSNHDAMPADSTNNDLFTVPVNFPANATVKDVLAATKNITADNKASDSTPLYSPDGKYIAYRAQKRPGYESDIFMLSLYDRKTGQTIRFLPTSKTDRWVNAFAWAPDSSKIYFTSEDKGESPIYSVSFKINPPEIEKGYDIAIGGTALDYKEIVRGYNDDLAVTPEGTRLIYTSMSVARSNELYSTLTGGCSNTVSSSGRAMSLLCLVTPITHLNNSLLSQIAISPLEPFLFTGAHGDKVEGFVVKPPNFDPSKKYPVKFLIHGGPQGAWGDDWSYRWNPELFAANGYVVIMINFHGSTGYGQKFIDAINGDWGGAPYEDLMKGLDYAESHYGFIDKDRECALGASYGGYMANWILGHTNRFKCIVSHDGMFDTESFWGTTEELWFPEWEFKGTPYTNREMYRKWSPALFAANFKTPTLVIHGQKDYRLDLSQGLALFTTLQRMGVPSKMLYFPDEGHWVLKPQNSQLWYKMVNEWVDQWTKK